MNKLIIKPDIIIRQAMKKLSQSGEKCLVIVNDMNILLGTLSDGDLRKAILNGSDMSDSIQNIYNSKPTVLIAEKYEINEAKRLFTQKRFDLIPIVNDKGKLIDILLWGQILNNGEKTPRKK